MKHFPLLIAALVVLCAGFTHGHDGERHDEEALPATRVLGKIEFPTDTDSAEAQVHFIQGMMLLHLFEYPFAEIEFQKAQAIDSGFIMAIWGEAMTHNHPIWDRQDVAKGRAALQKLGQSRALRATRAGSEKEADYLASLEILYGDGSKAERDIAYMRHLGQMALAYPDDHEVQLFYALSIMGASAGVRDTPAYIESAALSQRVFYANREHPGAAHYLIHAVDDPVHAPLGLEAARALAVIAPDAGHSLHMTSHIFTAMGLWVDVVTANVEAARVANAMRREQGELPRSYGHYNYWLLYGLLQQGRYGEAERLLRSAYREITERGYRPKDPLELVPERSDVGSVLRMWSRFLIESHTAGHTPDPDIARWNFNTSDAYDPRLRWHFTHAYLAAEPAAKARHRAAFRTLIDELTGAIAGLERKAPRDLLYLDRLAVMYQELLALEAEAKGDGKTALAKAREANRLEGDMPFSFGPPFVDLPSAQLLGRLLMDAGDFDGAASAYRTALDRARLKAVPLLGLAAAEKARGNDEAAAFAMAQYKQTRARGPGQVGAVLAPSE